MQQNKVADGANIAGDGNEYAPFCEIRTKG